MADPVDGSKNCPANAYFHPTTGACFIQVPARAIPSGVKNNALPQEVSAIPVDEFELMSTEVTNRMYYGKNIPTLPGYDGPRQPVVNVNWLDARAWCRARGWDLPTELQWESAARGASAHNEYATADGRLSRDGATYRTDLPTDVASYQPNSFGFYDLTGNVWEWTRDNFFTAADTLPPDAGVGEKTPGEEPKAVRGGSWNSMNPEVLTTTFRQSAPASTEELNTGFRCARKASKLKKT